MVIRDFVRERITALQSQLARRPHVDDRSESQRFHHLQIGGGQPVKAVGSEYGPHAYSPPVAGLATTDVTEVEARFERERVLRRRTAVAAIVHVHHSAKSYLGSTMSGVPRRLVCAGWA